MKTGIAVFLSLSGIALGGALQPQQLVYQGAFRMPFDPFGWQFSNGGMAFYPAGNDGAGSLVVYGHAHKGNLGEIAIPTDLKKLSDGYAKADLEIAPALLVPAYEDPQTTFAPGIGGHSLEYVPAVDKMYWGFASYGGGFGWCDADGSNPSQAYQIGSVDTRAVGDFLALVPDTWEGYSPGGASPTQILVTGTSWGYWGAGLKAAIMDYPLDAQQQFPARYLTSYDFTNPMNNWDMDDLWWAAAWPELEGDSAFIVGGTKDVASMGGDANAPDDLRACLLFFDPGDLSDVVHGVKQPYEPQPAFMEVQDLMFEAHGLKGMAYDSANRRIYALEDWWDGPVMHVWDVGSALERVPGDVHAPGQQGFGCVDGADYTIWADNYNTTGNPPYSQGGWSAGNFTEDDTVDGADYTIWADHYLEGCAGPVPEPCSALLILLAAPALVRRGKRSA